MVNTTHPDHSSQRCNRHSSEVSNTVTPAEEGGSVFVNGASKLSPLWPSQPHGATRNTNSSTLLFAKNKENKNKTKLQSLPASLIAPTAGLNSVRHTHNRWRQHRRGPAIHFSPDTFLKELLAKVRWTARVEASPGRPGTASPRPSMGSFVNKLSTWTPVGWKFEPTEVN